MLNLWLVMAPIECIRQVLVHEYIHFLQNNHSPEFYALLEQVEPQYRQLKHRLSVMVNIKGGTL
ncbi:MAG: M48 family metallopeptidase [Peptococcaceae bacterium]|nr:M48 family metallopeptidase [Peptococcaceae bacterium]